jgi:hypothetical protein
MKDFKVRVGLHTGREASMQNNQPALHIAASKRMSKNAQLCALGHSSLVKSE